ncbi:MAG: hypothetical protein KF691_01290 [Phycisphaeraceae bacterium]|nr:hypothetical protein [Phycisphaeraceae bacterium]
MTRFLLLLPLTLLLAACNSTGSAFSFHGNTATAANWPFLPTSMRIYPLTHIERGSAPPAPPANPSGPSPADNIPPQDVTPKPAEVRIIAHLEFRDSWGDGTKAIGPLVIFLYGPSAGNNARNSDDPDAFSNATQQRRYDIDLSDLRRNAELFDPATRTYRIPLSGLPQWIVNSQPDTDLHITLRAEIKVPRSDGSGVMLVDEYVVTK